MGDRLQRVKGKAEEAKGRVKQDVGQAAGRPGTEAKGTGDVVKGKTKDAVGKARGKVKKIGR